MTAPASQPEAMATPPETDKVLATRLVLNLKERRVYAYQENKVLASYPVAIGKKGWETPKGNFTVMQMIENPKWKNPWNGRVSAPGPNSPLGERWIGFWTNGKNYIGFHGTPGEHVMGQAVSHGCVRMRNRDVKALYELVKTGIPVIVQ
ncbi:L,D-transpeptidase [Crocosphaera sp. UHCC 0190]|nr:L,D-transpeptidase [Crocosphaera sp. UHCC 0190]MEA5511010.1 L,D-transpeptidase [Crocosphaera sp. UHCC 0190]